MKAKKILNEKSVNDIINHFDHADFSKRGMASMRYYKASDTPQNIIERYCHKLLETFEVDKNDIDGFEYWIKDNPPKYFSIHFDCDEDLRALKQKIVTPYKTSVLYLSDEGGATIVPNITTKQNADPLDESAFSPTYNSISVSPPKKGYVMTFPADSAHGVEYQEGNRKTCIVNVWKSPLSAVIEGNMVRGNQKDDIELETDIGEWIIPEKELLDCEMTRIEAVGLYRNNKLVLDWPELLPNEYKEYIIPETAVELKRNLSDVFQLEIKAPELL